MANVNLGQMTKILKELRLKQDVTHCSACRMEKGKPEEVLPEEPERKKRALGWMTPEQAAKYTAARAAALQSRTTAGGGVPTTYGIMYPGNASARNFRNNPFGGLAGYSSRGTARTAIFGR